MEAIKISVEVSVNLSENTQNFIKSLFAAGLPSGAQVAAAVVQKPAPVAPAKPAPQPAPAPAPKPQAPAAAPAPTKPAATPAPGASAAQAASSASKSIEDVRAMLAKKVNEHRDVIKQKLNELGAPSVTKLDPAKYDEMFNFLESL
jgi:hypothetical protein